MDSTNNNNTYKIVSISIIGLLLLLSGYLLYLKSQNSNLIATQDSKLVETEKNRAELEKNYYESLAELEELKGDNTELNSKIDSQKLVLKKQRDQIVGLIGTTKDYNAIKSKINTMRASNEDFKKEMAVLKEENDRLSQSNEKLSTEKGLLTDQITKERTYNDELATKNTTLTDENSKLATERQKLARKVDRGSVIKVSDILVEGYRLNSKGKEISQRHAKDVEILRVCFKTAINELVENGREKFFIKIINPNGETINVPSAGSGVIDGGDEGTQIAYSLQKEFNYENTEAVSCASWKPGSAFQTGTYNIEVYNKVLSRQEYL